MHTLRQRMEFPNRLAQAIPAPSPTPYPFDASTHVSVWYLLNAIFLSHIKHKTRVNMMKRLWMKSLGSEVTWFWSSEDRDFNKFNPYHLPFYWHTSWRRCEYSPSCLASPKTARHEVVGHLMQRYLLITLDTTQFSTSAIQDGFTNTSICRWQKGHGKLQTKSLYRNLFLLSKMCQAKLLCKFWWSAEILLPKHTPCCCGCKSYF